MYNYNVLFPQGKDASTILEVILSTEASKSTPSVEPQESMFQKLQKSIFYLFFHNNTSKISSNVNELFPMTFFKLFTFKCHSIHMDRFPDYSSRYS